MNCMTKRAASAVVATLLVGFALNAAAKPDNDVFTLQSLNSPFPEFVASGNSVSVRVTGPSSGAVRQVSIRLNGVDVSAQFSPDAEPGSMTGTVFGLQPGVNELEVHPGKNGKAVKARLTVSTGLAPDLPCAALTSITLPPSLLDEPTDVVIVDSAVPTVATATLPAHCFVRGRINPRIGVNNTPFAIGFALRLPDNWSGRFFFQGGGGNDGAARVSATGATGNPQNGGPLALARGFAVGGNRRRPFGRPARRRTASTRRRASIMPTTLTTSRRSPPRRSSTCITASSPTVRISPAAPAAAGRA